MTQKKSSQIAKEIQSLKPDEFLPYAPLRNDAKSDQGKPIAGIIGDFGLALTEVAKVGTLGAEKYSRSGWKKANWMIYHDAMWRHLLIMETEKFDKESGLLHMAHIIFDALVQLELILRGERKNAEG